MIMRQNKDETLLPKFTLMKLAKSILQQIKNQRQT